MCIKKWPNDRNNVNQPFVYYFKGVFRATENYCVCFFFAVDDTYMYDDAVRGALGRPHQGHWYDEPPYESDPDDFLMSNMNAGPAATIQVCLGNRSIYSQYRQLSKIAFNVLIA